MPALVNFLSKQEAAAWCREHKVPLSEQELPDRSDAKTKFKIPQDAGKRIWMVGASMASFRESSEILVWFSEWSVWSSGERMHVFDRFRMSYGETRSLRETPAHAFTQDSFEDAVSFVTIAVLFLWDCYVVSAEPRELLFFSHDEFGLTNASDHV